MSPWKWRLAGLGSGIVFICLAGVIWMAPFGPNKAQASVCFTTPAGCYCVDFFLTEVKERVINKGQEAVQEKISEQEFFRNYGIQSIVSGVGISDWLQKSTQVDAYRDFATAPFNERGGIYEGHLDDTDPEGLTRNGKQQAVINRTSANPDTLAPYSATRNGQGGSTSTQNATAWTDQAILETDDISIPDDQSIAEMGMRDLYRLYDQSRNAVTTNYARAYLQEAAIQQERIAELEASRRKLTADMQVAGAVAAGKVHAAVMKTAIELENTESWLRKESALALLINRKDRQEATPDE